jgi:hypothetical protein
MKRALFIGRIAFAADGLAFLLRACRPHYGLPPDFKLLMDTGSHE